MIAYGIVVTKACLASWHDDPLCAREGKAMVWEGRGVGIRGVR